MASSAGARTDGDASPSAPARVRHEAGRARWWWLRGVGLLLVLLALVAGWLVWRGSEVVGSAQRAVAELQALERAVRDRDADAASRRAEDVQAAAEKAAAATADPVWQAARVVPGLGDQLTAVSALVDALQIIATEVARPVADATGTRGLLEGLVSDGRVELTPLQTAAPLVEQAAVGVHEAQAVLEGIDRGSLVGPLDAQVGEAEDLLGGAADLLGRVETALRIVPAMLGAEGPREYLVLAVNNAELRAAGGIVGAAVLVTVDRGAVSISEHVSSSDFPFLPAPVLPLLPSESDLFGERTARYIQNVTATPDFPRTAELAGALWQHRTGRAPDGVVALDPVALAHLVSSGEPVRLADGAVVAGDGLVELLLSRAYAQYPEPRASDAFFAEAAATALSSVLSPATDPLRLVAALGRAFEERRLALWTGHGAEQRQLEQLGWAGGFLSGADDAAAGLFFDDSTGSKLGYYLRSEHRARCEGRVVTLDVTLSSTVPGGVEDLPAYVLGPQQEGLPPGSLRLNVSVFSPVTGRVLEVSAGGKAVAGGPLTSIAGREVVVFAAMLTPDRPEQRFTITLERPADSDGSAEVWLTPTARGQSEWLIRCQ